MKRTLKIALALCLFLLTCVFTLTACYYSPGEAPKFHVKEVIPAVSPTCTESGLTEGMRCSVCQDIIVAQEFIAPFGHNAVVDNAVAPTCTSTGLTEGKHCSVCNDVIIAQTVIDALGHDYVNDVCTRCGADNPNYLRCDKDGIPNENGAYILFGEYPQTIKADDVTIISTQDSRGYYLGSDGYYYAAVTATPWTSGYTFTNNATIVSGTVYYFKVESIRWRILSTDAGMAFILCDSIIAAMAYQSDYIIDSTGDGYTTANGAPSGTYANNYKYSSVRAWLNSTFYETAFTELQREIILTTMVDNGVYSTGDDYNPYVCEDTEDKIFLLSFREVTNSEYGFSSDGSYDVARIMKMSDCSLAMGVYMSTSSSDYGNALWWLRSPLSLLDTNYARHVDVGGNVSCGGVRYNNGVVPAMWITLNP